MKRDIHSITDLVTGPVDVGDIPLFLASGGWTSVPGATFNVGAYGALGNGVHDDTTAIQNAIDAAGAAGGGTVLFPPGDFFLNTKDASAGGGLYCYLKIQQDNIWLRGAGASATRLFSTEAGAIRLLLIEGGGKPAGHAGWSTYRYQSQTVYAITPVTAGATTITFTTPAQAGNFAAGDFAYLRTGQLTGSGTTEPDAEIVQVKSVNVGAGTISLVQPTLKDYVQEYFITGTAGLTTRAVTANLAAFGISNVTAMTLQNARISDLTIDMTDQSSATAIGGGQAWGVTVENLVITGVDVTNQFGDARHIIVRHNRIEITRGVATNPCAGVAAKGCADVLVDGNTAVAKTYPVNWQVNEGVANLTFINNTTISGPSSGATTVPFGAIGRPRNHTIMNNTFIHSGTGAVISIQIGSDRAATGCSGIVSGNILVGTIGSAIGVNAPGFYLGDNIILPSSAITIYESLTWWTGTQVPVTQKLLWGWVTSVNQTLVLGTLPIGSWPLAVYLHVFTAFDSDGTDQIQIGTDASPPAFGALTDVSTTGVKTVALATTGYRSNALITKAFYVNGGSEPAHGRALVGISYAMAPQAPTEGG